MSLSGIVGILYCEGCRTLLVDPETDRISLVKLVSGGLEPGPVAVLGEEFLGRYRLKNVLASGGMGLVFRGVQKSTQRPVAIKFMRAVGDGLERERFLREARVLARLSHPNIVALFDAGLIESAPYIVMELVTGSSLRQRIQLAAPLSPEEVISLAVPLLDALEAVHQAGLLHRDIKPDNILLGDDGRPRITDLGLVRDPDRDVRITAAGDLVGTPAYMSPEVLQEGRESRASDLYSFALVLFEMLTGQHPFLSGNECGPTLGQLWAAPPTARTLVPGVPVALDREVRRCMATSPEHRPGSAAELRDRLASMQEPTPRDSRAGVTRPVVVKVDVIGPTTEALPMNVTHVDTFETLRHDRFLPLAAVALVGVIGSILALQRHLPPPPPAPSLTAAPGPWEVAVHGSRIADDAWQAPTAGPPATWDRWQTIANRLPDSRPGRPRLNRDLERILAERSGIDLGRDPTVWSYWISLGSWLAEDPPRSPVPERPAAAVSPLEELGYEQVIDGTIRDAGIGSDQALVAILRGLDRGTGNGPNWLLLGQHLQVHGREPEARRLYRIGFERMASFRGRRLVRAYVRAVIEGTVLLWPTDFAEKLREWILLPAFADKGFSLCREVLARSHHQALDGLYEAVVKAGLADASVYQSYSAVLDDRSCRRQAVEVRSRGFELNPGDTILGNDLTRAMLERGRIGDAIRYMGSTSGADPALRRKIDVLRCSLGRDCSLAPAELEPDPVSDDPELFRLKSILMVEQRGTSWVAEKLLPRLPPCGPDRWDANLIKLILLGEGVFPARILSEFTARVPARSITDGYWIGIAGLLSNPAGQKPMEELLAWARKDPGVDRGRLRLFEALWHCRSGRYAIAFDALPQCRQRPDSLEDAEVLLELLVRPVLAEALSLVKLGSLGSRLREHPGPPRIETRSGVGEEILGLWEAARNGNVDRVRQLIVRLADERPWVPLYKECGLHCAVFRKDTPEGSRWIEAIRVAYRYQAWGYWALHLCEDFELLRLLTPAEGLVIPADLPGR